MMSWRSPDSADENEATLIRQSPPESGPVLTARLTAARAACLRYRWQEGRLWVSGLTAAHPGLPADLAVSTPEEGLELRLLVLLPQSAPPETWLRVRLVAALQLVPADEPDDWLWLGALVDVETQAAVSPSVLACLAEPTWRRQVEDFFARERGLLAEGTRPALRWLTAEEAAQVLQRLRVAARQARRAGQPSQPRGTLQAQTLHETPLSWQTAASLAEEQRSLRAGGLLLRADASLPFAEPARLLRFVAPRFQPVLRQLLDEDEQVLAFVERPPLRQAAGLGLLRRQGRYLPEGLLLVSDRQVLWLRAYFAQGRSFTEGGYVARTLPVERLRSCTIEGETATVAARRSGRGAEQALLQLVLGVTAAQGEERLRVEFPAWPEAGEALRRLLAIVEAFLPLPPGQEERRLRVWPALSPWQPEPRRVEELADLGGRLPERLTRRFEETLESWLTAQGMGREEVLLTLGLPALTEYGSPPRWLALTRRALLVLEATGSRAGRWPTGTEKDEEPLRLHCVAPWNLSSLELRYSLLGSGLTLYEPRAADQVARYDLPFAGPALALVLPLFRRLRTLLRLAPGMQARLTEAACTEKGEGR
ncbi:hypothetical protein [Thermogemmatispora aurantia]|uniref:hypothetical protein n=1 Tax=Thermogemmatispora aurantia TaxID=2045279 RepID=UPI00124C7D1D|nr:hypothetical protein [Thermogemmatispora aurantia]